MVVCTRCLELVALRDELLTEDLGVGDDLLSVGLPCGLSSLKKRSRDTRDSVIVRATLACREDSFVNALLKISGLVRALAEEDQAGARATEGLVSAQLRE